MRYARGAYSHIFYTPREPVRGRVPGSKDTVMVQTVKGYITIDPGAGPRTAVQVRAHCRATNTRECNRTLLWNVYPKDLRATVIQARDNLKGAGCNDFETIDLRGGAA